MCWVKLLSNRQQVPIRNIDSEKLMTGNLAVFGPIEKTDGPAQPRFADDLGAMHPLLGQLPG